MPGYTGEACELHDAAHGGCPHGCCGHGRCHVTGGRPRFGAEASAALGLTSAGDESRSCECYAGWAGEDCCAPAISERCPHSCSGHGVCRNGVCDCMPSYGGAGCERLLPHACPLGCSAHGECRDGACVCERGFGGEGCERGDAYGAAAANELPPLAAW